MIVKELDEFSSADKFAKAGRAAEEQIVHYLRRAFADDKKILVFNNLRLECEQDSAQIDHLILYRYGIIIVESKSVTTQIQVNEQGEWMRWFNGKAKGMPSPVLQAQRQGEFLKKYLNAYAGILLSKILGLQTYFGAMPFDILVAISDSGIINRPKKFPLEEVCKADQVVDRIRTIYKKRRNANSIFNFNLKETGYSLSEDELSKVIQFLVQHHKPLCANSSNSTITAPQIQTAKLQLTDVTAVQPGKKRICRHCQSSNLAVEYGKYGYYFKCLECDGNTPINAICTTCRGKEKIRKSSRQFYAECEGCDTSTLFYTNPLPKQNRA